MIYMYMPVIYISCTCMHSSTVTDDRRLQRVEQNPTSMYNQGKVFNRVIKQTCLHAICTIFNCTILYAFQVIIHSAVHVQYRAKRTCTSIFKWNHGYDKPVPLPFLLVISVQKVLISLGKRSARFYFVF